MLFIIFFYYVGVFVFGLIIGSFLNCVIYRLEKEESLLGRSYCPLCNHTLTWQDLFPVFSFLFLQGRCRYCRKKVSWQYPIVELITGLVFLLTSRFQLLQPELSVSYVLFSLFSFYIASSFIVILVYDLKHYIIPDKVLFPTIIIALLYQVILNQKHNITNSLLAACIGAGFFLLIFLVSRGAWIGFGDVKLAVLMGLLLGFPDILLALFLAFLFGAIISIVLIIVSKKGLKSEIPFAPFLIAGTFAAMFFGSEIINWYLQLITQ